MKIVIVGTAYPMRGGIAQFNALLYKYLSLKADVSVYSFKRQYPEFLFPGKTQFEKGEPAIKIPSGKNSVSIDSVNPFNWIINGYRISKLKPKLLIFKYWIPFFAPCFFTISLIVKLFSDAKVLYICDNVVPHEKRFGDKFFTWLAFLMTDYFIVMSKKVESDLNKTVKKCNYRFAHHPVYNLFGDKVDKDEAKNILKNKYNLDFGTKGLILFFGYIRKYKGVGYLIDAMNLLKGKIEANLLIAGESYEDEKIYTEQIKKLNLENEVKMFTDFIPDSDVRYFFSACDVVVLPYIDATQSGIIQIAYFYDKPVIATNVGGLSEIVNNNETGFIVKPESPESLAEAIEKFYDEGAEHKFSKNVKQEKQKYMWENFTDVILDISAKKK